MLIQAGLDDPVTDLEQAVTAVLDGDGCLEVVVEETDNISAVTDSIYKLIDGRLVQAGSNGIGW